MAHFPRPKVSRDLCYWHDCVAPAVTDDHVPARAFFPSREAVERDMRVNLLTVRSCEAHNASFNEDETYAAATFSAAATGRSELAQKHLEVFMRAFDRPKGDRLAGEIAKGINDAERLYRSGGQIPAVGVNLSRVDRVVAKIARGLHYRLTGHRLEGEIGSWYPSFAGGTDNVRATIARQEQTFARIEPWTFGDSGSPEVFRFAHHWDVGRRVVLLAMQFFQSVEVRVIAHANALPMGRWDNGLA